MSSGRLAFLAIAALFVAACGGAGTVSFPAENFHTDPTGDALGPSPTYDVTEVRSLRGSPNLQFSITTTTLPLLPAPGFGPDATQMLFLVGFDTDLNAGTGIGMGGVCGLGQGLDFAVIGFNRNANGTYLIENSGLVVTGEAAVGQSGNTITLTVPLAALGGDDGRTNAVTFASIDSDFFGRDCAPNAGTMATKVGEKTFLQTLKK